MTLQAEIQAEPTLNFLSQKACFSGRDEAGEINNAASRSTLGWPEGDFEPSERNNYLYVPEHVILLTTRSYPVETKGPSPYSWSSLLTQAYFPTL